MFTFSPGICGCVSLLQGSHLSVVTEVDEAQIESWLMCSGAFEEQEISQWIREKTVTILPPRSCSFQVWVSNMCVDFHFQWILVDKMMMVSHSCNYKESSTRILLCSGLECAQFRAESMNTYLYLEAEITMKLIYLLLKKWASRASFGTMQSGKLII